jgi:glucose/arabinose dehydrogenase
MFLLSHGIFSMSLWLDTTTTRPRFNAFSAGGLLLLLFLLPHALAAQKLNAPACAGADAGITLPPGFCAIVVADHVDGARHIVVAPNGDVFVAVQGSRTRSGGVIALRDTTGDGKADVQVQFGVSGGNGIALVGESLYFAPDNAVLRYSLPNGALQPAGAPDTIVQGLPARRGHVAKSIAVTSSGTLYVNIGSETNACQPRDRAPGVAGTDPCTELETRAGIWQFSATRLHQRQTDGKRYATGLRNVVALTVEPGTGELYGLQHGRDQLHDNWPKLFTEEYSAENPGEIFAHIRSGEDYGWPYCYWSMDLKKQVLAPEYGGDGTKVGRCAEKQAPLTAFPGHWAPNGVAFYTGTHFPAPWRDGVFIAFHGSWNRAPLPQAGFKVVFLPMKGGVPQPSRTFADGFAGAGSRSSGSQHRPVGVAQGPDGSLFISDDAGGRIWRVVYTGK